MATTLIYGATVNGIGVQITEEGVKVSDSTAPGAQKQVNDALSQGNMTFTLARSTTSSAEDKVTGERRWTAGHLSGSGVGPAERAGLLRRRILDGWRRHLGVRSAGTLTPCRRGPALSSTMVW